MAVFNHFATSRSPHAWTLSLIRCQIKGSNSKPMSKPCLLFHSSVLVNVLTWSAALRFQCRPSVVSSVALQRSHLNGDGLCADVYAPLISQHWGAVLQTATVAHAGPKSITNNSHTPVTRQVSSVNWIAQRLHVRREKLRVVLMTHFDYYYYPGSANM